VRQLSHDLRNQLNAAELQSAYMKEVAEDSELKEEVQRLRGMLSEMGTSLHRLTTLLATPNLTEMQYDAKAFLEDLEQKVRTQFPEQSSEIAWDAKVGTDSINIDPQLLQQAMLELISNALQHERGSGNIAIQASTSSELRVTITEPKTGFAQSVEHWGREPFRKVKHGHYGLGLHRARNIIEAHRGRLEARHDPSSSSLITTVALPIVAQP